MSDDTYRVVLVDGGGQCAGWLSNRLQLVNAAWEAGEWTWEEAKVMAAHANRDVRKGLPAYVRWHVVPVRFEAVAS